MYGNNDVDAVDHEIDYDIDDDIWSVYNTQQERCMQSQPVYGLIWEGPYAATSCPATDQIAVLDCFNAAISVAPATA